MNVTLPAPIKVSRFRPRLLDALAGYDRGRFLADAGAGVTVGIVALPLAMAFAIASGVKPEQGIFTAIIGGFLISALGGSHVQIGGPAGAFIVIVYGIVQRYGIANLLISTMLAGVLMFLLGWLRLGALVRYIPVSIVIGFTNGIAVLIALSQLKDLLGLQIAKAPADFFAQVHAIATHLHGFNPYAFALGALCVAGLFAWPRLFAPGSPLPGRMLEGAAVRLAARMPGPIVALVTLSLATAWFALPVETIGMRFGGIPQSLPAFVWPDPSWDSIQQLFIPTLTIAALGAIESLLCARVADNLVAYPHHDPNQELMAQGVANVVVPFFGGIPATGTVARTVTNVRAGAVSPVAGIIHAGTLLLIILVAAPLAVHVPLAVLGRHPAVRRVQHGRVARVRAAAPLQRRIPDQADRDFSADRDRRSDCRDGGGTGSRLSLLRVPHEHAVRRRERPDLTRGRADRQTLRLAVLRCRREARKNRREPAEWDACGAPGDAPARLDRYVRTRRLAAAAPQSAPPRRAPRAVRAECTADGPGAAGRVRCGSRDGKSASRRNLRAGGAHGRHHGPGCRRCLIGPR
jgi:hypothetical protein